MARRLLYLNTQRLFAYAWQQGRLVPEAIFEAGEEGLAGFAGYLAAHGNSHFSLLANVADEGHVLETIPFLRGKDRQTLIARKIGQHFPTTQLAAATSLGYEKTRRKNEKLLFSALTKPSDVEPWLQRIAAAEAPLVGLYTVAQLGALLLKKLGHDTTRCLLLSIQAHSIRETYLAGGHALFSRTAPFSDSSMTGVAKRLVGEASKLQQYLIGQRLIAQEERLPVFLIAHPRAIPAIAQGIPNDTLLDFTIIDNHEAAHRLRLKTPPDDNRCDILFLQLLASAPPKQQFAGTVWRRDYQRSKIRHALLGIGLVALLGSMLFSAGKIYQANSLRAETRQLSTLEADLDARYQKIAAAFPQLGIDNDTLRHLSDRYRVLRQQQRRPDTAYRSLGRALDALPAIELKSLEWKMGHSGSSTATLSGTEEEITTVRAVIHPEPGASVRHLLQALAQFADHLHTDPANTVVVTRQPLEIESGRVLRGGDGDLGQEQPRHFVLQITRKARP